MKKTLLTSLLLCAFCVALAPATSFSADQIKDQTKDQIKLKDGSCQDLVEALQELEAN